MDGVVLLRTATELRGTPCNEERDYDADGDSMSCLRSFGVPVTTIDAIRWDELLTVRREIWYNITNVQFTI